MSWSSEASKDPSASRKKPLCVKRLCFLMFPLSLPFLEKLVDFLYCLLETTRKYPLMLLFPKQPGFCILLLQAVYPLQSLRATVGWEQGRPHYRDCSVHSGLLQIKESLLGKPPLGKVTAWSPLQPLWLCCVGLPITLVLALPHASPYQVNSDHRPFLGKNLLMQKD